ncbi:hypothetical protein LCGC14_2209120 [marine sediment metagenome]|uniref:Elp3/MiaA/NifB-like radical SAM core domain-containing protein n=1 Tax=marine sediment metagenome TaxID=412755 RepID=A0A0F9DE90_9ZZZZ
MIALWNLEPKCTNIALEKIHMYYQQRGESVVDYFPLEHHLYDKIYCSSLFDYTDKRQIPDNVICGGTGFDLTTTLPYEIDAMKPKLNMGFTTRGCIRKCPFCVVPEKEGWIRETGDIYDFWDGKSKEIVILDNNILAVKDHFKKICRQIKKEKLLVDFNQGLDHRLLTNDIADMLKSMRRKLYRFSFDSLKDENSVRKAIDILNKYEIKWSMWYVLTGYDTGPTEDLMRLELLKVHKQRAYIQRYQGKTNPFLTELSGWVNKSQLFMKYTFDSFLETRGTKRKVNDFLRSDYANQNKHANTKEYSQAREAGRAITSRGS